MFTDTSTSTLHKRRRSTAQTRPRKRNRFLYELATEHSEDDEAEVETVAVRYIDNHVWFCGEVNRSNCLELQMVLFRLFQSEKKLRGGKIVIHLQTDGGCVFSGFNIYDLLQSMQPSIDVEVVCEGNVASSGTIILLGAQTRKIRPNGMLLIHEISGGCWGKYSEMKDEMENMSLLSDRLMKIYKKHTSMSSKTLKQLLSKDLYMDAEKALQCGLVTDIIV